MSAGAPGYRLVPLDCPSCGAAVRAEGEDLVYYCTACRNGYRFDSESSALEPVEVSFVVAPNVAAERYLPFWLLPATVEIPRRVASGAVWTGLVNFFLGRDDEAPGGEGTFVVPAFHAPLEATARLTREYTERFPELGERLGERLTGGRYGVEDARRLARFALVASEVHKPDLLKDLEFRIEFREPRLLGVPFVRRAGGFVDALFGIEVGNP